MKTKNTDPFNTSTLPVEKQITGFFRLFERFVGIKEGRLFFYEDGLPDRPEAKNMKKYTYLLEKVKKAVDMTNKDISLLDLDGEDLWKLL